MDCKSIDLIQAAAQLIDATRAAADYTLTSLSSEEGFDELECLLRFDWLAQKFRVLWFEKKTAEDRLRQLDPSILPFGPLEFEQLTQSIFYVITGRLYRQTSVTNDGGVDLIYERHLDWGAVDRYIVQCKLYRGYVPVSHVRDFFGTMTQQVATGYFVTTGTMTKAAVEFIASANKSPFANRFHVVDLSRLRQLMEICEALCTEFSDPGDEAEELHAEERLLLRKRGMAILRACIPAQRSLF
ncbi:hypothetical protein CBA19CS11_32150 [Caballeronia novacaledonica]|uniref:restriction endonuclease n=1 Tax=Caballeronia novacaledonica TaxID=1544861 RepID=UPI001EE39615|nr:restriction endonuclease [Caballeronia novacaledonica]GJH13590.1 hypothetical protein CBA19CS11_32150 [Caballeronia novacaledonica]